jgi:predicted HicB family RNase H-like nuclease
VSELIVMRNKLGEDPAGKGIAVAVTLSTEDHRNATNAALANQQSLAEWIASLVNTALQP